MLAMQCVFMCVCGMSLKTDSSSTSTRLNCGCQCLSIVVVSLHPAVLIFSPQGGYLKLANRSQHLEKQLIWPRRISLYCVLEHVGIQIKELMWVIISCLEEIDSHGQPDPRHMSGLVQQNNQKNDAGRHVKHEQLTPSMSGHHDQSDIILQTCFQYMQLIRVILGRTVPTGSPASTY